MKKFYTEPDFELVNITLISDVLYSSTEQPTEDEVIIVGTEFEDPFA